MIFKNKVAIVTGASRGIGRQIVLMLAREGAKVVFSYSKSVAEAESLMQETGKLGVRAIGLQIDVRDFEKTKELIEKAKSEFGGLDILVNNAGITRDKAMMMMTREEWLEVLDTNLNGYFNVTRNAIVTFLKQKSGNIVNITSVSGIIGLARQTNYAASKAGIIGLTKSLAREVAAYGIRVNAVAPGFIATDMLSGLKQEFKDKMLENIPLSRLGSAEDVSRAVKFLLSDASSYITGQVLVVDGGLAIR
jgi:3-oxoacyl-[acyl-carrier protein] reductase